MKSKRLNCCFTLIVIISTITLILSTKPIWADQMVGHSTEKIADQNNSSRTITLSPFAPPGEISEITHHGWGFPGRDDGSGELVWSSFDEDGISGKVDISADGQTVAIGYTLNGERLEVRNGADGEILFTYEVEDGGSWVSVSGDGRLIAYSDRDAIRMFERNGEGDPIFEFSENDLIPSRVSISNSGDYLIATGIDPNIETNVIWGFIIGEDEPAWVLEVDAEESYGWYGISIAEEGGIVAVNGKYHLYVIDLISGDLIWDEPTYNSESGVSLSEDGTILTIGSLSGRLRVFGWDVEDEIYFELWHYGFTGVPSNWITAVAVSPDGNFTAAGTLDFLENGYQGRLAVFDNFGNGEPIWITDPLGDEISDIQFNLDGTILAASSWGDIENETPDLVIHETHNPEPFFRLVSPGALSAVAISSDGSRIVASGKSVHNRVFGRGGRVYMVETTISGGEISGVISDSNGDPIEGAVVEIEQENPYSALSDQNGEYTLRVEFDGDERQVEVTASGPGFINSSREINVRQNQVIEDVDFALDEADAAPQNLAASQGVRNVIRIQWDAYNEANAIENVAKKRILTATGNIFTSPEATLFSHNPDKMPDRDDSDDAEAINIYRSVLQEGPFRLIATVEADAEFYEDRTRLFPLSSYYYVVTAVFENGESDYSNQAIGWVNDQFLDWDVDLESMVNPPEIDGTINEEEWNGAQIRDISDVFGYDALDSAGTVEALIGFSDDEDFLYLGFKYFSIDELENRVGVGVYVDDDGDGVWDYGRSGSEGNFWGYWVDEEPLMVYRSLSGPPYNRDPYLVFENPNLGFSIENGYLEIEMAIPMGFHTTEEVAVYAPDYTIGLGLFALHRDEEENPIFNGWWPQNMLSIVSNPYQFGRVSIPVDLIVPPSAPTDVFVDNDDPGLVVFWEDPVTGIDEGEIEGLEGLIIKRNGVETHTSETGSGFWYDDNVSEFGWYEYQLAGYVLDNDQPFLGPFSDPVGKYAVSEPDINELSHDDGTAESMYVVDNQGNDNRFAVKYNLDNFEGTLGVYWADFFTFHENQIDLYLTDDNDGEPGDQIGQRFTVNPNLTDDFYRFHFPGVQQPRLELDPDESNNYWVILNYLPASPGAPALGVDRSSADPNSNMYYTSDQGWVPFEVGNLMFRIGIGTPPATTPEQPETPPLIFTINQNFPNPFNGRCMIPITIPRRSNVRFDIFDINGRKFDSQLLGERKRGSFNAPINVEGYPAGLYLLKVSAGTETSLIKFTVAK